MSILPSPIYPAAGGQLQFTINNSAGQGILSFGGFAFPILGACSHPDLTIQRRDDGGDVELQRDVTISPAGQLVIVTRLAGAQFDQGGSGYVNDGGGVTGFCSHGRWETNAGVPRVIQRTTQIEIRNDANTATIETWVFDIEATFTG